MIYLNLMKIRTIGLPFFRTVITILVLPAIFYFQACSNHPNKEDPENTHETTVPEPSSLASQTEKVIAFYRNGYIYTYHPSSYQKTQKWVKGNNPKISPNGRYIIYTKYHNGHRKLFKLSLDNHEQTMLDIPSLKAVDGAWSPDSRYIACKIYQDFEWKMGMIRSNNTDFYVLKDNYDWPLYGLSWSLDGRYITCHNLTEIFKYDPRTRELKEKIDIRMIPPPDFYLNENTRMLFTRDERHIIFNTEIDELREDIHRPVSALFAYNFSKGQFRRLTRDGLHCMAPMLDQTNNIYFEGFTTMTDPICIYRINLSDTTLVKVLEDALMPSITY